MGEEGFEPQLEIEEVAEKRQFPRIRGDLCQQISDFMPADRSVLPLQLLLISSARAARLLGIGERTLWQLRHDGFIRHVRIRSTVRYRLTDLEEFVDGLTAEWGRS